MPQVHLSHETRLLKSIVKQNKTRQDKTSQNKTKQNKTKNKQTNKKITCVILIVNIPTHWSTHFVFFVFFTMLDKLNQWMCKKCFLKAHIAENAHSQRNTHLFYNKLHFKKMLSHSTGLLENKSTKAAISTRIASISSCILYQHLTLWLFKWPFPSSLCDHVNGRQKQSSWMAH